MTHRPPPLFLLGGQIAALALARRVARCGAPVAIADRVPDSAAWGSRYCRLRLRLAVAEPQAWLDRVLAAGRAWGESPVLLATSDEWLLWASHWREQLATVFRLRLPAADLLARLLDKRRMPALAAAYGLAAPRQAIIAGSGDLVAAAREVGFPCLLKSAASHPGGQAADAGKRRVADLRQLAEAYAALARLDDRVLLQEYLSGSCQQVALYNGYFAAGGVPLAALTGRKRQQYPLEFGTACLSESVRVPGLAPPLTRFFQALGYAGPVDVGLKYDPRSGQYKILDINPRLGQNHAGFRTRAGEDVGWLAYADAAGLLPAERYGYCAGPGRPVRWGIGDDYVRAWRLARAARQPGPALREVLTIRRCAFWSWRDPAPWLRRLSALLRRRMIGRHANGRPRTTARHAAPTNDV